MDAGIPMIVANGEGDLSDVEIRSVAPLVGRYIPKRLGTSKRSADRDPLPFRSRSTVTAVPRTSSWRPGTTQQNRHLSRSGLGGHGDVTSEADFAAAQWIAGIRSQTCIATSAGVLFLAANPPLAGSRQDAHSTAHRRCSRPRILERNDALRDRRPKDAKWELAHSKIARLRSTRETAMARPAPSPKPKRWS